MAEFTVYDDTADGEPEDTLVYQPRSSPSPQAPTLNYATPGVHPPATPPVRRRAPSYADITRGASVLHILAKLAIGMGVLSCVGCVMLGARVIFGTRGEPDWEVGLGSIASGLVGLLAAMIVAALLNFIANIGVAVRDVAVNSFKR